jgi:formylglycine-generating enzyme required for sulfatase activity
MFQDQFDDNGTLRNGPEMVVVPAGRFTMGSSAAEIEALRADSPAGSNWLDREQPQQLVTIAKPFAIGRFAVTLADFAAFIEAYSNHDMSGGAWGLDGNGWDDNAKRPWRSPGFKQADNHPVTCVNWHDAQAYIAWLNGTTGSNGYRLPSEAEWEYCCRAAKYTRFWWGDTITSEQANYNGEAALLDGATSKWRQHTMPVNSFDANGWGLHQVHGNVFEWCEDTLHEDYSDNPPNDGSVWQGGTAVFRVLRGGSWSNDPHDLRAARRDYNLPSGRASSVGFRLARTLVPPA